MELFALENRKKYTKLIVDNVSNLLLCLTNNNFIAASLVVFFHSIFILFVVCNLIDKDVSLPYYFYTFIWIMIIYLNYYFHGCILARIEQHLFQNEFWTGPVNLVLFPIHLFYKPNKDILNAYIKYFWCAPVSALIIFKYLLSDTIGNRLIGLLLFTIFAPLLFIYSQSNIFAYIEHLYIKLFTINY